MFYLICVHEWPPFGKELFTFDHMFSLYFNFVVLVISRFGFDGGI